MNEKEIIKNYIKELKKINKPHYDFELKKIQQEYMETKKQVPDKIINDLRSLNDKELCKKYKLEPKDINIHFTHKTVNDLRNQDKSIHITKNENNLKKQIENYKNYINSK